MLSYKDMEHVDKFSDDESVFWIEVSGVPETILSKAKKIDGVNYCDDGFGVCIQGNMASGEFAAIEDEPDQNLYYVDNLGEKHWFDYKLSEQEMEQITDRIRIFLEEVKKQEQSVVADLAPYYVAAMPEPVQEEIRQKVVAALTEAGQCTPENIDNAMCSKIYDLEDLIDIREYVKKIGDTKACCVEEKEKCR